MNISSLFRVLAVVAVVNALIARANIVATPCRDDEMTRIEAADGKWRTYVKCVRLSADEDVQALYLIPSQLTGAGTSIPASNIRVVQPQPLKLDKGNGQPVWLEIDTSLAQGDIRGILAASTAANKSNPISLGEIRLRLGKLNVTTLPATFSFQLTRCGNAFTCWIADRLPEALRNPDRQWGFQNQGSAAVAWIPEQLIVRGDKSATFSNIGVLDEHGKQLSESVPLLPASKPTVFRFAFSRDSIEADHYQGQFLAKLKNVDDLDEEGHKEVAAFDAISVPFAVDVRDGPLLALVVLVVGIALGRLIQSSNSPQAQARVRLMQAFTKVSADVNAVRDVRARGFLQLRLSQILIDIESASPDESALSSQLVLIARLMADCEKLDDLAQKISALTDPDLKANLSSLLSDARADILIPDAVAAETAIQKMDSLLSGGAVAAAVPAGAAFATAPPLLPTPATGPISKALSWLSGAAPQGGEWMFRYGRPLMFLLLLVLLAFVGLYNSYVKNATFGSEGFFDYLGLFLWGISADVAQKTLQNLTLNR
ncbi:hypothetical protein ACFPT7_22045 [Acidicapsa dinghuensis]|uniref:Protein BatD n=1 Tax=Acidicapsa dinghuensis TaxID=2218256 RepID=A0ABW1EMB1_9BACT|nr:hypothetical protein [Acidicapsa dinghuensis]